MFTCTFSLLLCHFVIIYAIKNTKGTLINVTELCKTLKSVKNHKNI